ncbi:MAG TPA: ABC transporter permease [Gemmatimonadaceae bacterium]
MPATNLRLGIRLLRRAPGFLVATVLTLALGIGLWTAAFTVGHAILIRELPVRDQERLVLLWGATPDGNFTNYPMGLDLADRFTRQASAFDAVGWFTYQGAVPVPIRDGDRVVLLRRALVSGNYFDVLGVSPLLGRGLRPADDEVGAEPVVVLSHAAWQDQYGGDPDVVGRRLPVHENGVSYTIVGVMPPGLRFPAQVDFWAAVTPINAQRGTTAYVGVNLLARLRTGATADAARAELAAFYRRPDAANWQRDLRATVNSFSRTVVGDTRPALLAFWSAAALLLVIACANVAGLLMVRGLSRSREFAVRSALGAARGRVVRQLLGENAILASLGGALGVVVAVAAVRGFIAFAPAGVPRLDELAVNSTALVVALLVSMFVVMLFGLAPAISASRVNLQQVLRSDARQSASRGSRLAAEAMVAGQVALAFVVLSASGLIVRSLIALERAELSFEPRGLLIGSLALRVDAFDTKDKQLALLDRIIPRIEAVPGVRAVSPVVAAPFSGTGGWDGRPSVEGQSTADSAGNPMLNMEVITAEYFATFGIPILRGRAFTDRDREDSPPVIMLSEGAARHYWPSADPVGQRLRFGAGPGDLFTVVGIVPETRYRDLRDARPSIYFPLRQSFFPFAPLVLAIRTTGPEVSLLPAIRQAAADVDAGVAFRRLSPFSMYLDQPLAQPRLNAFLLTLFSAAAVGLASVGLFGVMTAMVRQRTRELGVRVALGATVEGLRRMVIGRGIAIAVAGLGFGLLGAQVANRSLAGLLFEVQPTDGRTLSAVVVMLLVVTTVSGVIAARRSVRVDPMSALRNEV